MDNQAEDNQEATSVTPSAGGDGELSEDTLAGDSMDAGGPPVEVDDGNAESSDGVSALRHKLQVAEDEKKANWDKYLRATADMENLRRRTKRDIDDAKADTKSRVLKEMLPVVDNLERALEHAEKSEGEPQAILEGVRLVLRQFTQAFERIDVTPVEAIGTAFDPNLHEAISQIETAEHPAGTVVTVLQKGYRVGERLLRPAMVVVAKPVAAAGGAGASEEQTI